MPTSNISNMKKKRKSKVPCSEPSVDAELMNPLFICFSNAINAVSRLGRAGDAILKGKKKLRPRGRDSVFVLFLREKGQQTKRELEDLNFVCYSIRKLARIKVLNEFFLSFHFSDQLLEAIPIQFLSWKKNVDSALNRPIKAKSRFQTGQNRNGRHRNSIFFCRNPSSHRRIMSSKSMRVDR